MKPDANPRTGPPGALARPDWQAQGELTATDLRREQGYFLQRARRHLRLVHTWGIVCGLDLVPVNGSGGWEFVVCPGYGIGPCGDEVFLPRQLHFSLKDFLWTVPMGADFVEAWVQIEACQIPSTWQAAASPGCGCEEPSLQVSRIADVPNITIAWTRPPGYVSGYTLCSDATPPCPVCPESCGLTLGSVVLPARTTEGS